MFEGGVGGKVFGNEQSQYGMKRLLAEVEFVSLPTGYLISILLDAFGGDVSDFLI